MKIKIKLESLENILNLSNSFCTIGINYQKNVKIKYITIRNIL